jgi:HD-GYP domain-containing protein (c-di-GMP phosphodiesterase class II)
MHSDQGLCLILSIRKPSLIQMPLHDDQGQRWLARSRTGFLVSTLAIVIPIALSVAVAYTVSLLLPSPSSHVWQVLWWSVVLGAAWLSVALGERLVKPLLPLASLLKMSLLFPDRAPSRFSVAWRSGSTRQLDRYAQGTDTSIHPEPMNAAVEILTLVTALSSHDRRTRGHSERVRAYTDLLADEMHLSTDDRDRLRWASLLHDVGKMTVHSEILNKSGEPTEEEWKILRRHPLEGRRLIQPIREWLGPWGLAVEQHHENYDGTGYPFGLVGGEISLGARIVSVADAYEVMTAIRSYKSPMSPANARKELTRCAGTQFDPVVVRAFLNISIGKQRWIIGPMALLFDVPIVSQVGNLGNVLAATSQVALVAGSVAMAAVASGGNATVHTHTPAPVRATNNAKQKDALAIQVSSSRIEIAGSVYDSANFAEAQSNAGGAVTYLVYNNRECSSTGGGLVATLGPVAVTAGHVPNSPSWTASGPTGTYFFVADYSGNANYVATTSGCASHPVAVMAKRPTLGTQLSASSTIAGGSISAGTALLGGTANATGTITYYVYANDSCSTSNAGLVATLGPVAFIGGTIPASPDWTATTPGTYYFVASYSGDANNAAATSGCASDPFTVTSAASTPSPPSKTPPPPPSNPPPSNPPPAPPPPPVPPPAPPAGPVGPANPTITTTLSSNAITVGATLYDGSTLSGATSAAGGTVTYDVYANNTCASAGLVTTLGPVTVTSGVVPNSPNWTATTPGTYYFVASYSGDATNAAATSGCASEAVVVSAAAPTITTTLSSNAITVGATVNVDAVMTGLTPSAGGNVTYRVYTDNSCTFAVGTFGPITVTNGDTSGPITLQFLVSGTFYVVASYSGDINNAGMQSGCASAPVVVS